jgi:hypothetical protein
LKNLKEMLKKPSRDSQPWALWNWNFSISPALIEEQLDWFADCGFGGVAIRPSRDMVPVYLSEEFFELFLKVLRIAGKHGIAIRIADDFSLPWSGCFSSEMAHSPRMRAQQLRLVENRALAPLEEVNFAVTNPEKDIYLSFKVKNGQIDPASVQQLTGSGTASSIKWKAPEGDWTLLIFKKEFVADPAAGYIPNVFNPKMATSYIQQVFDVFKVHCTKHIPGTFEGFITELPSCRPCDTTIPWDDDLVVKFRSKSKKNIVSLLPALFCDNFPGAQKSRQQIYSFIFQSMYERFVLPLETWVKKNRLSQWVLAPERSVGSTTAVLADGYVPPEADLSAVGFQNIDGVIENYALLRVMADANSNEFRRETVSVIGRNRTGNGATIQSLKNDIDSIFLSGTSRILIDGFFFNIDQRSYLKTPVSPGWYSPEGKQIKELCGYVSRLQELIKGVHWNRQVAVLTPTSETMAAYLSGDGNIAATGLMRLEKTIHALERRGISYDLISETLLSNCSIRTNGEFGTTDRIRKGNYQVLIIPFAPDIARNVLIFIEKLVLKEGRVLFVEEAPRGTIEDGVSATMSSRIEKILASRHKGTGIIALDDLESSLESITPLVKIQVNGKAVTDLYHAFGSNEGHDVYLFHNFSDQKEQTAAIECPESKHFTMVDCENGHLHEIVPVERGNGVCTLHYSAYPSATAIVIGSATHLAVSKDHPKSGWYNPFTNPERGYRIVLKDQWVFSTASLNALPLANWNIRIGLSKESGGFSHFYETHFQAKEIPGICNLIINDPSLLQGGLSSAAPIEVTINGIRIEAQNATTVQPVQPADESQPVETCPPAIIDTSLSTAFGTGGLTFPVREHLVRGFNRISIRTTGQVLDPGNLHYPPLIFGDFILVKGQNGWAIDMADEVVIPDSWVKHGYPYLCGKGVYRQSFEIPNEYRRLVLRFAQVSGTVEVTLNEKSLGVFNWQPVEIDITPLCELKRNDLVISVTNSIDTILRLNCRPSGLIGEVFLDVY